MASREEILNELHERMLPELKDSLMAGLPESQGVRETLATVIDDMLKDPEFISRFQYAAPTPSRKLKGSKFARYELSDGDIEFLYDIQRAANAANPAQFKGPSEQLENAFQDISDAYYVPEEAIREIDQTSLDGLFPRVPVEDYRGFDRLRARQGRWQDTRAYESAVRAMDTAESGYGQQLVGAQYVGELWASARFETRITNLIRAFDMTGPTSYLPIESDLPEMIFVSQSTSATDAEYATSKTGSNRVQVDAKKMIIHQKWSGEMVEDSILQFIPFLRRQAVLAIAHYTDSAILNGDTTSAATGNINLDDAAPSSWKHYMAFDGLRKVGLVNNTNNQLDIGGALTWAHLVGAASRMVDETYLMDWGHPTRMSDVVHIVDFATADKIMQLTEIVNSNIERQLPLINGQVTSVLGRPVISSMAMSKTEADGKVSTTGSNNTKGQILTFNVNAFVMGWRRRVQTELERIVGTDQWRIVHSMRMGFGRYAPSGSAGSIEAADVMFNITV